MISPQLRSIVTQVVRGQFTVERRSDGLSSADIYRLRAGRQHYALKGYPVGTGGGERLASIHQLLSDVHPDPSFRVPQVYCWPHGATVLEMDDRLWELSDWLPGRPLDECRSENSTRIEQAIAAIAAFHRRTGERGVWQQESGGIRKRFDLFRCLRRQDFELPESLQSDRVLFRLIQRASDTWNDEKDVLLHWLSDLIKVNWPCQWIHGDLRKEHVLLEERAVPAIIDFGAARIDLPAFDLARFLGTAIGRRQDDWEKYVKTYSAIAGDFHTEFDFGRLNQVSMMLSVAYWLQPIRRIAAEGGIVDPRILQRLVELLTKTSNFDIINKSSDLQKSNDHS